MPVKKLHMRFALKTPLFNYTMRQLARKSHLNEWNNYIQVISRDSK